MDVDMMCKMFNPSSSRESQQMALNYLTQLKNSKDGWNLCASILVTSGTELDEKVKFLCLQVLTHYTKNLYSQASTEDQLVLRQYLSQWMSVLCSTKPAIFIRNKTAQVFAFVFLIDYIDRWPTFISDLIATLNTGPNAVDLYLKILLAIDVEIVDREVIHTSEEAKRNTLLKDKMRERCVLDMTNSWFDIMVKYETSDPSLVCQCHDIVGAYISWIDIGLVANDKFVGLFLKHLKNPLLREAASDCIHEIFMKGMEPLAKVHLIELMGTVLEQADVLHPACDDDSDFLVKLSKLVNCMGVQLILSWQKLDKHDAKNRERVRMAIENKVSLLMQFMANEYDDVSSYTFDFARDYIQLIKQSGHLTAVERGQMENMLCVIINKSKYDEAYNFNADGEDEAMFDEYRKKLKVVFDNLSALVPDVVLKVTKDYVTTTLNRWQASPYEDVEAAISLLYSLGEAIPGTQGNHFSGSSQAKTSTLGEMMTLLVTSNVCRHSHPAVALYFFECVTRYEKFFAIETRYIPQVLQAFLDQCGIRNPSVKVRSRVVYLFSRFVRCLKTHLVVYTEQILAQIPDLLTLGPFENGQPAPLLNSDEQLYIYESASLLIIGGSAEPQQKCVHMRNLLTPILTKVNNLAQKLAAETHPAKQILIARSIMHATAVTAKTSKAFSNQNTMESCQCVQLYLESVQLFISCLNVGKGREEIGSGLRQLMHRLVVCLGKDDLIPILPAASQALLQQPTPHAISEYLPLINQIITKFKKDVSPFVQEIFAPLVSAIFVALSEPIEENDEEEKRLRKSLQRSYFLFLTGIVNSEMYEILEAQDSQQCHQVLASVAESAVEFADAVAQKYCFLILRQLILRWAAKDSGPPQFLEFIYSRVIPACFMAPTKCTFNLADAQAIQALQESTQCLQVIHAARGEEMINYLRTEYFPKISLSPQDASDYCHALASDAKMFRNYSKFFYARMKS